MQVAKSNVLDSAVVFEGIDFRDLGIRSLNQFD